ncbi:hypothetical protein VU06_02095, partial [Desulfobulbus sp. F3]|nr:hypothetical protein [Desulfobulbus sp. F3]
MHIREVHQAAAQIAELNPYPGNAYNSEPVQYIAPDLYVVKTD